MTRINVRYNASQATLRKVEQTRRALDTYRDKQFDEINYCFDELINILNARRDFLLQQVNDMVSKLKIEFQVDFEFAEKKREEEGEILQKVRDLQNFVFSVQEKENKRVMVKWRDLIKRELDFEVVDRSWENHRFYINQGFRFPDD